MSRGTVSRVLNGGHWVSPTAREAVERAIKKTGYRINPHARNLATARANSIAFLLTESHDRLFEDPNFSTLMRGAADALADRDLPLVLLMAGSDDEQRRATEFITARARRRRAARVVAPRARGVPRRRSSPPRCPSSRAGCRSDTSGSIGYVAADDLDGARDLVAYLRDSGRSRIATITGPIDTSGGIGRLEGYRQRARRRVRRATRRRGRLLPRERRARDGRAARTRARPRRGLRRERHDGRRCARGAARRRIARARRRRRRGLRRRPHRDARRARRSRRCASRSTASRTRWCACSST